VYHPFFIIIQSLENKIFDFRKRNSHWHLLFVFLDSFYLGSTLVMIKVTYDRNINIFSFVPWSLQYQKNKNDYIIFLIKSFPFIVILQHTIQYLHVENIFKRMVYWLHKETHETISTTLDKGSMTKHASISRREAYVKLLCWVGECSHVQEILVVGQSNGSFWKINCECTRAHPN